MKSVSDSYEEPGPDLPEVTLHDLASLATLFANDMKHVHLHSVGPNFDIIHELTQTYYDQLQEEADWFYEMSVAAGEGPKNPTMALSCVGEELWKPEASESYEIERFNYLLIEKGTLYYNFLSQFNPDEYDAPLGNFIDELRSFWYREIYYKANSRGISDDYPQEDALPDDFLNEPSDAYTDPAQWGFTEEPSLDGSDSFQQYLPEEAEAPPELPDGLPDTDSAYVDENAPDDLFEPYNEEPEKEEKW